jgi:peroxiredoxin
MFDLQYLSRPLMWATLLAALLVFSHSSIAIEIGELAPGFELRTVDGELFRLTDYRGKKAVFLIFWNTWCTYCIKKTPRYAKLKEQFGDRVEIIAVNTTWHDSIKEIKQFQQRFDVNYPIALDNGEALTDRYAVSAVPTEFIIDINGVIRYRDGIPEYLAAHIPDWFQTYTADMKPIQVCLK